jgi:LacI family transcriptional regulator
MRSPTLHDVARSAGVSYSTADRVLNGRGGVAEKSALRVRHAIEALGYVRDIHAANLSRRRSYRFRFFLPRGDHGFFSVLRETLAREAEARAAERLQVSFHDVPALDAGVLAAELGRIAPGDCDCAALVGADAPELTDAIARLRALGIPVVTLVSDTADEIRSLYVGINNRMAGRTAGRLMRMAHRQGAGRILILLGSLGARDHRDRLDGAREIMAAPEAGLQVLPPIEVQDRPEIMAERLAEALGRDPDISGLYSIGAGNRALVALFRERAGPRPFAVLHELTPVSRAALEGGLIDAVIDQKPAEEIARALDAMRAIADGRPPPATDIVPTIYLRDNLPGSGRPGLSGGEL